MNDGAGSEGTGREDAGETLAIARTADARLGGPLGLAEDRITASADRARATGDAPRDDDPVIRPHGGNRASDVLDDAGAFVTEEDREGHAPAVRDLDVEIGVEDAARGQADEDLVVPEIIEGNRLDSDTLAGRVQHRPPIAHCERLRPFLPNGRLVYRPRPWHGWWGRWARLPSGGGGSVGPPSARNPSAQRRSASFARRVTTQPRCRTSRMPWASTRAASTTTSPRRRNYSFDCSRGEQIRSWARYEPSRTGRERAPSSCAQWCARTCSAF